MLVCFQRAHIAGGIVTENMRERDKKREREKGNIRAFQGKLMEDWTAQIQPQDTHSVTHTHLHTSPIRPDDCLGARWQSTSLSLTLFPFSLHNLPQDTHTDTHTEFQHANSSSHHTHTRSVHSVVAPSPAQTGVVCPPPSG